MRTGGGGNQPLKVAVGATLVARSRQGAKLESQKGVRRIIAIISDPRPSSRPLLGVPRLKGGTLPDGALAAPLPASVGPAAVPSSKPCVFCPDDRIPG